MKQISQECACELCENRFCSKKSLPIDLPDFGEVSDQPAPGNQLEKDL